MTKHWAWEKRCARGMWQHLHDKGNDKGVESPSQNLSPHFLVCIAPLLNLNEDHLPFRFVTTTNFFFLSLKMQGPQDTNQHPTQPDKIGWLRKFCGKGLFREIWKNRFVILKGEQLYISEKEVSDCCWCHPLFETLFLNTFHVCPCLCFKSTFSKH